MALPPQAVERMVQEPSATQGAYKELLTLCAAFLLLMVVLYAGLKYGYTPYLRGEISKIDKKSQSYSQEISLEDQKATADFYAALTNLRQLVSSHTQASPILAFLERTVMPDVYYNKVSLNTATNQADLAGFAKNLDDVAEQAAILEKQPEVARVNFSNAGNVNNAWQFTMSIWFVPVFLHTGGSPSGALQNAPAAPAASSTAPAAGAAPGATTTAPSSPAATGTSPGSAVH